MSHSASLNLVDHLFRHESGKMIAMVVKLLGVQHLETAEDVVQEAFYQALQAWPYGGIPEQPAAWLMQVAKRRAIDWLRKNQSQRNYQAHIITTKINAESTDPLPHLPDELQDGQLQLIFACCHPSLVPEDRIALTLKIASGFGTREIASALLMQEETVRKRLYRARKALQDQQINLHIPAGSALTNRLESVLKVFYLLFNEGYQSSHPDWVIRQELCAEAMRLTHLVWQHPRTREGSVAALMALMSYHVSRLQSRTSADHDLILLADQDRTTWNKSLIAQGHHFLNLAMEYKPISIYHLEAAIAAQHCIAHTLEATDWPRILHLYDVLEEVQPSPVLQLNKVVVLMQLDRMDDADALLQKIGKDRLLQDHHLYHAVTAAYYTANEDLTGAREALGKALMHTTHPATTRLYIEKLNRLDQMEALGKSRSH